MLGFDAGLFFIDASALEDRLRELAHTADPPLQVVVLDFEGVNYIDSQGSEKVGDVLTLARAHSAELRLARVKPAVMEVLRRDGFVDRIGDSNIYGNVFEASRDLIVAVEGTEGISPTDRAGTDDGWSGGRR